MDVRHMHRDPRIVYPQPPFEEQEPIVSGDTREMNPKPDHGELSYIGHGLLEGRVAIVTGGDSGIGRAICIAFAREGANVMIGYHTGEEDAESTAEVVRTAGKRAVIFGGDVGKEADCERMVAQCVKEFGSLDILVNNAAFQTTRSELVAITTEEFDRAFKTNVYGTFFMCRAALPQMQPGACIINTASIQSFDPSAELLHYASTKAAIANMTMTLSDMCMKHGVRVNAVAPGPVWTPLIPSTMPVEKFRNFGMNTVFKRPAQPAELAPIFVFLASQLATYVTGEIYGATGGRTPL